MQGDDVLIVKFHPSFSSVCESKGQGSEKRRSHRISPEINGGYLHPILKTFSSYSTIKSRRVLEEKKSRNLIKAVMNSLSVYIAFVLLLYIRSFDFGQEAGRESLIDIMWEEIRHLSRHQWPTFLICQHHSQLFYSSIH